jgi:uncharacterized cupin superfamily protein
VDQQDRIAGLAETSVEARTTELETWGPKVNATSGEPVESARIVYEDDRVQVGVWECTPGSFPSARDGITEIVLFVGGDGTIHSADGPSVAAEEGRVVVLPDGWQGSWDVEQTLRKFFVIVRHPDGAPEA